MAHRDFQFLRYFYSSIICYSFHLIYTFRYISIYSIYSTYSIYSIILYFYILQLPKISINPSVKKKVYISTIYYDNNQFLSKKLSRQNYVPSHRFTQLPFDDPNLKILFHRETNRIRDVSRSRKIAISLDSALGNGTLISVSQETIIQRWPRLNDVHRSLKPRRYL